MGQLRCASVATSLAGTTGDTDADRPEGEETTLAPSSSGPAAGTVLTGPLRVAWYVGLGVFLVQFILLVVHSAYLWDHFDLTADFGQYSQAWQQIATGHLNPYDTTYAWNYPHYGYPFYQGDLELIMWPLSLLYWVSHSAFDLLLVQDAALAGAGLVAYRWVLEHLENHAPNRRFALIVGGSCSLCGAAAMDVLGRVVRLPLRASGHLLPGVGGTGPVVRPATRLDLDRRCAPVRERRDVVRGRSGCGRSDERTAPLAHGPCADRCRRGLARRRRSRALGKGAALARLRLPGQEDDGERLGRGIFTIVTGMVVHPNIAGHVIRTRFGQVYNFVGGAGTVGIFSAVGARCPSPCLLPSVLNTSPSFISDIGGSQNFMAVVACAVGIAMLATWLTRQDQGVRRRWRTGLAAFAIVLAVGSVVETALFSAHFTPLSGQTFAKVDDATAAQLSAVSAKIPNGAETIVSQGVVGRFGERHSFYPYFDVFADGQTVPVFGRTVYVVLVPSRGSSRRRWRAPRRLLR